MNKIKSLFQSLAPIILALLLVATSSLPTFAAQPMTKERPPETEIVVTPTDTWAVEVAPGSDPDQLALSMGAENLGQIGSLENIYLFRIPGSEEVSAAAELFAADAGVVWFEQQVARERVTRVPSDPLYGDQWHFPDANVPAVWTDGYTGSGVNIAIVDDGLQHTHPDLSPNYQSSLSWDFVEDDSDPAPSAGHGHGTSAAGVAAARDDGASCGVGVAYRAGLSGLRLITPAGTTDAQEASALQYEFADNHIYNNSWGPPDVGYLLEGPGILTQQALLNGVTNGRGGKGSIYVWAAGNGLDFDDNVNYDGYANSRFTIAVGAVDENGVQSWYSEPGAAMLVTAPSSGDSIGITTTDLLGGDGYSAGNCTNGFGGTSSSSPLVAGVVALMLEANPDLGWRDVQHILVKSALKNDPTDAGWTTNGAGYPINHKYGFGMVDAQAAVNHALTWTNVSESISFNQTKIVNQVIPDGDETGITSTINVPENFIIEHVEVVFTSTHTYRGDLRIVLTSPSGTESVLAETHVDATPDYSSWKFMTTRNWNETTAGNWTLRVSDPFPVDSGTFDSWQLILHGFQGMALSDYDGDGKSDPAKFYPSNGVLWWQASSTSSWENTWLGNDSYDLESGSDYDGDGKSDPAKFVSSIGTLWYIQSSDSSWNGEFLGVDEYEFVGRSDFDGDGKTDPAKFVSSIGALWYIESSSGLWQGVYLGPDSFEYLAGNDFDGDGKSDPAKYVPSVGVLWYYRSTDSTWDGLYLGVGDYDYISGNDYDGDGKSDPTVFYASTGTVWWQNSSTGIWDGVWMGPGTFTFVGGHDFDGDRKTDLAKFDPVTGLLSWLSSDDGEWHTFDLGTDGYDLAN